MMGNASPLNQRQLRKLDEANRTILNLQNQVAAMQRGSGPGIPSFPYGGPPIMNPSLPYPGSPMMSQASYPPPSPLLQRLTGQSSYPYAQKMAIAGDGYRDTDYAAVANIAGLNPGDVALLHREYISLTRGGMNKLDRVVFRQLLRDAMIEANNENVDRAIENIFVSIDRNHDGFIDFPEFVGAFRDTLKGVPIDPQSYLAQYAVPELINEQIRGNSNIIPQPFTFLQQPQSSGQVFSIPSSNIQQTPLVYNGGSPLVISLDSNQSPYIGQQPGALQCIPLPIM
jgi:hypothetical protein